MQAANKVWAEYKTLGREREEKEETVKKGRGIDRKSGEEGKRVVVLRGGRGVNLGRQSKHDEHSESTSL